MSTTLAQRLPGMRLDPVLAGTVTALLLTGLVMVYSVAVVSGIGSGGRHLALHLAHTVLGISLMLLLARVPPSWWLSVSPFMLPLTLLVLAAVLLPGVGIEVNGSTRWISLGPLRAQPAEAAKFMLVVYTAGYLARRRDLIGQFRYGVVTPGIVLAVVAMLLLMEPDFGSTVVIGATVVALLFLGGMRLHHFLFCALAAAGAAVALTVAAPYRMQRVMSFLNPWSDPYDSGFQLVQALIAFGRGEWLGVGLGESIQKLHYLPHASTDFLLAVIGEELGLVGVLAVIALFAALLWRAFAIAGEADAAGRYFSARLAQGAALLIGLQAMINIGVNLGVLPTKGLTLPFMSYGGTSLVVSCAAAGVLLSVERENRNPGGRRRRRGS